MIIGDFNEAIDGNQEGMTRLCNNTQLVDMMFQLHGNDNFNTCVNGKDRIDYVLCDEWIADACIQGCYEPFMYRFKGDHRNIVSDFDSDKLFRNLTYSLHSPAHREFSSKDKGYNQKYINWRYE